MASSARPPRHNASSQSAKSTAEISSGMFAQELAPAENAPMIAHIAASAAKSSPSGVIRASARKGTSRKLKMAENTRRIQLQYIRFLCPEPTASMEPQQQLPARLPRDKSRVNRSAPKALRAPASA